ncbi:hypothetical protein HDZ31DRAFT_72566 [Schizophyllum fasciatum]
MQFKTLFTTLALAFAAVSAEDYVKCETSDVSPPVGACQTLTDGFKGGADPDCARPHGSACHTSVSNNMGCAFELCQQKGTQPQCSDPASAAKFTQQLIDECASNGKVGGYYHQDLGDGHWLHYQFVHS